MQEEARRVLTLEGEALLALRNRIGESFDRAVEIVLACRGRVVVTGMGKSGIIGRKIAATLASVGSPALFVHPAEGVHGDIGMVARGDCAIAISRSGETIELLALLPSFKRLGVPIIALTARPDSPLAQVADAILDVAVREEACNMDLVPTASTTAALAMGDALAVAVLKQRGWTSEDYAKLHPSGALGRRLLLRVEDIMRRGPDVAAVPRGTNMRDAILEMTAKKVGAACVIERDGRLAGIVTDHDLRRVLAADRGSLTQILVDACMTEKPMTIHPKLLVVDAIRLTESKAVSVLPVVDTPGVLVGLVHLHDLLRSGAA